VVRKIVGAKREEITGDWRNLCNEELYDLYSSPNTRIIRCIKSREVRMALACGIRCSAKETSMKENMWKF
jgi:hypothetical protein